MNIITYYTNEKIHTINVDHINTMHQGSGETTVVTMHNMQVVYINYSIHHVLKVMKLLLNENGGIIEL